MIGLGCVLFVLAGVSATATTFQVDRLTDANPLGGGEGSDLAGDLRYALTQAQPGDAISIGVAGTIQLTAALPVLARNICIQGPGANLLTVNGVGGSVFAVHSGATVTLSRLAITGGVGHGGGIYNQGTVTVNDSTIRDNTAGDPTNGGGTGAGIWNDVGATLTMNGSTVSGNSAIGNLSYAPSHGGGVANYGTMTLNNSTISGNSASQGFGGGVSNPLATSVMTLHDSTVSANSATAPSGGVDNRGILSIRNSIIAGNTGDDLSGDVLSEGYNLFGITDGGGFTGTDLLEVVPLLGPLQDNGGPTETMAPLPGSPAIDRTPGAPGVNFPATDQRGIPRPQGALADTGGVEIETSAIRSSRTGDRDGAMRSLRAGEAQADSPALRSPILHLGPDRGPTRLLGTRGGDVVPCAP
jgi:hypothetical protein